MRSARPSPEAGASTLPCIYLPAPASPSEPCKAPPLLPPVLVTGIQRAQVLGRGRLPSRRIGSFTAPTRDVWIPGSRPGMTEVGVCCRQRAVEVSHGDQCFGAWYSAVFDQEPGRLIRQGRVCRKGIPHSPSFQALSLESTAPPPSCKDSSRALMLRQWASRTSSCSREASPLEPRRGILQRPSC
ncbi:UNVERIFIED_ORG: hypothetical protein GGD51_001691 [Rhizobium esperanzae]